jgi:uncharacterized membrane protein YphA (DoxX/SURF4 family)
MKKPKLFIALLRMSLGWIFIYQGFLGFTNPEWSLKPYIQNAQTFPTFYAQVEQQPVLRYASYAFKSLYIFVGMLLMTGISARIASFVGCLMMLFLYFAKLNFPYVGANAYIINEYIINAIILLYLFLARHGEHFSIGKLFKKSSH